MKKYISIFLVALLTSFGFTSCDVETDEEPGGTAIEEMAGLWDVTCDAIDEEGNVIIEDPFGTETFALYTYNNAANDPNKMWIYDAGVLWNIKFEATVDYASKTIVNGDYAYNPESYGDEGVATISNGKVLQGAGKNLHGNPCDSIVIDVLFNDDTYAGVYYDRLRISGTRFTGFYE